MASVVERFRRLFETAECLNAALWGAAVAPEALSVQLLAEIVSEQRNVAIEFKLVKAQALENEHVLGHIERYDGGGRAVIYIVRSATEVMKRAIGVKEVCQVALDGAEDFQPDGEDTLQRLVSDVPESDAPENFAVVSEEHAEILSWELLYPLELRQRDAKRIAETCKTPADMVEAYAAIAERLSIPIHIVETVLSPPWLAWSERWWRILAEAKAAKAVKAQAAE